MPETTPILRCLTLDAHWAWAVREGMKLVENRKRGVKTAAGFRIAHEDTPGCWVLDAPYFLAVHSGMKLDPDAEFLADETATDAWILRGHISCVVRVERWYDRGNAGFHFSTLRHTLERKHGRWLAPKDIADKALVLTDLHKLATPVRATGAQGLWLPSAEVRAEILSQLPAGHLLRGGRDA